MVLEKSTIRHGACRRSRDLGRFFAGFRVYVAPVILRESSKTPKCDRATTVSKMRRRLSFDGSGPSQHRGSRRRARAPAGIISMTLAVLLLIKPRSRRARARWAVRQLLIRFARNCSDDTYRLSLGPISDDATRCLFGAEPMVRIHPAPPERVCELLVPSGGAQLVLVQTARAACRHPGDPAGIDGLSPVRRSPAIPRSRSRI